MIGLFTLEGEGWPWIFFTLAGLVLASVIVVRQAAREDRQEEFEVRREREEFQRKQKLFEK